MKIPKHISEYLIVNPPIQWSYIDTGHVETIFKLNKTNMKYRLIQNPKKYNSGPYNVSSRFAEDGGWTKSYVDSVVDTYIKIRWTREIEEICEA
jgi:hypothetical protein